jgi:hypothetical protein
MEQVSQLFQGFFFFLVYLQSNRLCTWEERTTHTHTHNFELGN